MAKANLKAQPELTNKSNWTTIVLILGIVFVGANLRAPLTAIGSLLPFIRDDIHMSNSVLGLITTVPLLAFALFSPLAPKFSEKIGLQRTILLAFLFLTLGIALRSLHGATLLFSGTIIIGLAIAICNVLLPVFIKVSFPKGVGIMTGVYSVFMNLTGALASGISVPLAKANVFGWQGALAAWGALSLVAALIWLPQLKFNRPSGHIKDAAISSKSIWKSRLAWKVTIFMGLQSLMFYTLMTWLPEIMHNRGYSEDAAGWMLSLMQFALIPFTFFIPIIADKMANQRILVIFTSLFYILGVSGLLLTDFVPALWVIFIGIGTGSAFSLSMMFFTLRTKDGKQAAALSGMAQSIGYLLAASGPVIFGALHDISGGWTLPLGMLIIISVIIGISGFGAGKEGTVESS